MNSFKRIVVAGSAGLLLVVAGTYAMIVYRASGYEPGLLLACVDTETAWRAWTCKQILRHASLTPDQVLVLNAEGGALYPALMDDPVEAEQMLALFVARGVDINAGDKRAKGRTALHAVAIGEAPVRVEMLLRHGASVDVQDSDGRTPLDLARAWQSKHPDDPRISEIVRLLETPRH